MCSAEGRNSHLIKGRVIFQTRTVSHECTKKNCLDTVALSIMPRKLTAPSIRYSKKYKRHDLIWVQYDRYPWWPAILIEKEDLLEDEGNPEVKPNQKIVQFFDDQISVCAVHSNCIRPFFEFLNYFCTEESPEDVKKAVDEAKMYLDLRLRLEQEDQKPAPEPAKKVAMNGAATRRKKQKPTRIGQKRPLEDSLDEADQISTLEQPTRGTKRRKIRRNPASSSRYTRQTSLSMKRSGKGQLKTGSTSKKAELNRETEKGDKKDRSRSRANALSRGKCLEVLKSVIIASTDPENEISMGEKEAQDKAEAVERCLTPTWEEDSLGYYRAALTVAKAVRRGSSVPRPRGVSAFVQKHLNEE